MLVAQVNIIDESFYSEVLQQEMMVDVYLPPDYEENPNEYYPVIYFLHGWGGNQNDLINHALIADTMISNETIHPFIMVCANNKVDPFHGSMYMNSPLWGDFETFNFTELIDFIEDNYRAISNKYGRALMGQSMGATGCFENGPSKKNKFCAIAAHGYTGVFEACLDNWKDLIKSENSGPPYFYDFESGAIMTKLAFLSSGAYAPNQNCSQTWIDPAIVEFPFDDQGEYIDTVMNKWLEHSGHQLLDQLSPEDEFGILFGTGENDGLGFYPGCLALKDYLDEQNIPYQFYSHSGGHGMPDSFKQEAYIFLDSIFNVDIIPQSLRLENPMLFSLSPNPVNHDINISFYLVQDQKISIEIIDLFGKSYPMKTQQLMRAGNHSMALRLDHLPSGIYFCELKMGDKTSLKKLIKL